MTTNDGSTSDKFILLELAGTTYGIRSRFVQQLEMVEDITPVPNSISAVEGVVFARGQVIPAVNLRVRFGFAKIAYDLRTRLVVVNVNGRAIGLVVDVAREFATIPLEAIKAPPETISNLSGSYLEGIATLGKRIVIILNLDEVVKIVDEQAGAVSAPDLPRNSITGDSREPL